MNQPPSTQPDPTFIIGDARSGTTYLTHLLIQHPAIGLAPETRFVPTLLKKYSQQIITDHDSLNDVLDTLYAETKFRDWGIERTIITMDVTLPITINDLIRMIIWHYCQQNFPNCVIWGIKKGSYTRFVNLFKHHFPQVKFIFIVRDGRAVFNSKKKAIHTESGKPFATDPFDAATRWCRQIKAYTSFAQKYPNQCYEVKYETLIQNPPTILQEIYTFLGIESISLNTKQGGPDWVPQRYQYLHPNVYKPPQTDRIDAWQQELSTLEIKQYEALAAPFLKKKGYMPTQPRTYLNWPLLRYRAQQFAQNHLFNWKKA